MLNYVLNNWRGKLYFYLDSTWKNIFSLRISFQIMLILKDLIQFCSQIVFLEMGSPVQFNILLC